jgi:hypothetical protein
MKEFLCKARNARNNFFQNQNDTCAHVVYVGDEIS